MSRVVTTIITTNNSFVTILIINLSMLTRFASKSKKKPRILHNNNIAMVIKGTVNIYK